MFFGENPDDPWEQDDYGLHDDEMIAAIGQEEFDKLVEKYEEKAKCEADRQQRWAEGEAARDLAGLPQKLKSYNWGTTGPKEETNG